MTDREHISGVFNANLKPFVTMTWDAETREMMFAAIEATFIGLIDDGHIEDFTMDSVGLEADELTIVSNIKPINAEMERFIVKIDSSATPEPPAPIEMGND